MEEKIILTIDVGTQSVRVGFINNKGDILGMEQVKYNPPYFSKAPGYAEVNPDDYLKYIGIAFRTLNKKKNLINKTIAVAIDYFRDSIVVTKDDMVPLRPAILWLDQRRARGDEKLPIMNRAVFRLARAEDLINLNRTRTPALWIKENEPAIWEQVTRYMNLSTYINYKFTGEYKDSESNCIGHLPVDYKHRRWYRNNRNLKGSIYGVDVRMLCDIVSPTEAIGVIQKEASKITGIKEGLPFFASGSDKGCETFGLGVLTNNSVGAISFGTGATIQTANRHYITPAPLLPAYPAVIPGYFNAEAMVNKGYWMLTWFAKEFCQEEKKIADKKKVNVEEILDQHLNDIPPGSNGLLIQPFWGPTITKPMSRGSMVGFVEGHTKYHIYKAIIEGIDYELKTGLELIQRRQRRRVNAMMVSGGGSQSDEICQIAADIFNIPIHKIQTNESSSLGAAMVAFIATKVFNNANEAIESMVHITKTFEPIPNNVKLYRFYYKQYKKIYPALEKPLEKLKIHDDELGL